MSSALTRLNLMGCKALVRLLLSQILDPQVTRLDTISAIRQNPRRFGEDSAQEIFDSRADHAGKRISMRKGVNPSGRRCHPQAGSGCHPSKEAWYVARK